MNMQRTHFIFLIIFILHIIISNEYILQIQATFNFGFERPRPRARSRQYHRLPLGLNATGPEAIAFDCEGGGPYVGVSDGRILKQEGSSWTVFAVTSSRRSNKCDGVNNSPMEQKCGRPLGLKFNMKTCDLYIVDASYGLVMVDRNGGVATSLATSAEGIPFTFLNDLDIDSESGAIYFTDSSSVYHRWEYVKSLATFDQTGRLIKYDTKTKSMKVLLKDLYFANGVALSKNKDYILVVETTICRILKYWLKGPNIGTWQIFLQLIGVPDNINRNAKGEFWIAITPTKPIRVDESGMILEKLDTFEIMDASDVREHNGDLWIGAVDQPYVIYTT